MEQLFTLTKMVAALVGMKRRAGRPVDHSDLAELRALDGHAVEGPADE